MTEPWGWIAGLAAAGAVLTGLLARSPRGGLYAGVVLLGALPLATGPAPVGSGPARPVRQLAELVLPDVWAPLPHGARNLVTEAWSTGSVAGPDGAPGAGDPAPARSRSRLHVGIAALCLALLGLVGVAGRAAWAGRGLLAAGLLLAWTGAAPAAWPPWAGTAVAATGLAVLAGAALADCRPVGEDDPVTGALVLGGLVVVLAGGLAAWAAWAGTAEARDVTAPLLDRLAAPPAPADVRATAAHLVEVLDQAALAALAAMTAILLHLKGRRLPTALLVLLVTAAELWVARAGWPPS